MQRSPPQQRDHPPARKTHKLASTQFSVFFSFWIIQAIFGPHPASRGRCRPGSSSPPPHIPPHPLPSRPISSRSSILTAVPSFTWVQLLAWNQQTSRDTVAPQDGQPIAWTNSCPGCIRTCMGVCEGWANCRLSTPYFWTLQQARCFYAGRVWCWSCWHARLLYAGAGLLMLAY